MFQMELLSLVSGRLITQEQFSNGAPVAMVSSLFAEANNLQIGSTFALESNVYNSELMMSEGVEASFLYWHLNDYILAQHKTEFEVVEIFDVNDYLIYMDESNLHFWVHQITDLSRRMASR